MFRIDVLVLDIGNTRLKWAGFANDVIVSRGAMFLAEVEAFVVRAGFDRHPPTRVVGSHVANQVTKERIERQFAALNVPLSWITSTPAACGVINGYDDPSRLGTDRWAAVIGAPVAVLSHPLKGGTAFRRYAAGGLRADLDFYRVTRGEIGRNRREVVAAVGALEHLARTGVEHARIVW